MSGRSGTLFYGGWPRLLISLASPTKWGAPSFALLAKGGYHECIRDGVCPERTKSCAGSIAAHPCKKRKDGAPSVATVHATIVKGELPASSHPGRALTVRELGALSDLDNITVRIADVAARLAVLGYRLRDELGSSTFP